MGEPKEGQTNQSKEQSQPTHNEPTHDQPDEHDQRAQSQSDEHDQPKTEKQKLIERRNELLNTLRSLHTLSSNEHVLISKINSGELIKLAPLVVMPRGLYEECEFFEQRWLHDIAYGWSSRGAVLVGKSAARVHMMGVIERGDHRVELTVPSGGGSSKQQPPALAQYRRSPLADESIVEGGWVRVTTKARTVIDIARWYGLPEGIVAADWFLAYGNDPQLLWDELERMGPVHGKQVAAIAIELADAQSDSAYESLARGILLEAEVDVLGTQIAIDDYLVDLGISVWLGLEVDGDKKYSDDCELTRKKVENKERFREKQILNSGYQLLRYTPQQLRQHPKVVIAEVKAAIEGARARKIA